MKSQVLTTWAWAVLAVALPAQAQQIYRSVGPDGRVTFSDHPPAAGSQPAGTATSGAASGPALPFELRQAATRFPVTLYTSSGCAPCGSARTMLSARGIPYSEKMIGSPEDLEALQRLSGETGVPFLTIGSQQLKGFSETEWTQFLNAAGYPKTSQLPPGYRNPPPAPLVAKADAAAPTAPPPPPSVTTPAPAVSPANPTGIKF